MRRAETVKVIKRSTSGGWIGRIKALIHPPPSVFGAHLAPLTWVSPLLSVSKLGVKERFEFSRGDGGLIACRRSAQGGDPLL